MRAIGLTLSRLPAARAVIAGAAFLAGAAASLAHAQSAGDVSGDDTAMALPRVTPFGGVGRSAALPAPLAPSEAGRVKRILALQAQGDVASAGREAENLTDPTLLGHILAARYLGRQTVATPAQLKDWLTRFADEPDAPAIHALLARKLPKGSPPPPLPARETLVDDNGTHPMPEEADPRTSPIKREPALDRAVRSRATAGSDGAALRLIDARRGLGATYASLLQAEVAQELFLQNRDEDAFDIAARAVRTTPVDQQAGLAGYVAGLAAWRMGRPELARSYFEGAWRAPFASPALQAAGAYWAARAHLRIHNAAGYATWLKRAADGTRTFYGLIARRTLGHRPGFSWEAETLGEADAEAIAATPEGRRALAYLQIGEPDLADAELRHLWPSIRDHPPMAHALMLVAGQAGLTDLAAEIAESDASRRRPAARQSPLSRAQPAAARRLQDRSRPGVWPHPRRIELRRLRRLAGRRARADADHAGDRGLRRSVGRRSGVETA